MSVVSTVASASYNYILLPVAGAAASAGKAIYTYVLVPCGTATMACGRFLVQAGQVERFSPWEVWTADRTSAVDNAINNQPVVQVDESRNMSHNLKKVESGTTCQFLCMT